MNKKEFAKNIIDVLVERKIFEKNELEIQEVYKNNDVLLTGIVIKTNHSDVATSSIIIYVDDLTDESIDDIIEIFEKQKNAIPFDGSIIIKDIYNFDSIKKHIRPYIINAGSNKKLLSDTPHTKFLDLAVIYSIYFMLDNRTARVTISNNLLSHWGITVEELDNVAKANFQNEIDKVCIKNIQGVIQSILDGKSDKEDNRSDEDDCKIYVVSTKDGVRGAICMCFDEVLEKIEYVLGTSEFYIIPSSIHEVLVLKSDRISPNCVKSMIAEVNNNCVGKHEILSYSLYKYVKGKGIEIA